MSRNILLKMEYDGSAFHGWQEQKDQVTVQGTIEEALAKVLNHEVKVAGTSRTDAGVHALGQCCSFFTDSAIPVENLPLALNNMLAGGRNGAGSKIAPVRVLEAREMPESFHARFDCKGKTYEYRISNGFPDVFSRNYCYYIEGVLDVAVMREGAKHLVGEQDFVSFQASGGTPGKTTVRTIKSVLIEETGASAGLDDPANPTCAADPADPTKTGGPQEVLIKVTGDGFLYNMVRIITGTLIEVGLGKRRPEELKTIINGKDRSLAGHTAPPEGLYLKEIFF